PLVATEPVVAGGIPIRVVHVPGKENLTRFALEVAEHALTFFSDWFAIAYPAEKLDLLAIPDFSFGAMENLGCVTFRETALLVDPDRASRPELERVALVIAHEIAHMWFGDLVTMKWWNGIWLNEAFATFMELLCVDAFRPEWEHWLSFGRERDVAMATDSLHATRPVEYPVGPPEEAQGMLDVLTYQKGAGVLRMLERYLGAETFQAGIRRYLESHRLGNTETADLWDAIEDASGEPVRAMMDTWILQGGFPLVSVSPNGAGEIVLSQAPFHYEPPDRKTTSAIGDRWQIPVLVRTIGDGESKLLMVDRSCRVGIGPLPANGSEKPVVVNAGGSGFYRVAYSDAALRQLAANLDALSALECFNLCGDTWASVMAGRAGLEAFLSLAEALEGDDPDVWAQVTGPLALLDLVLGDDTRHDLASYARLLLGRVLNRLGWEPRPDEADRTPKLRAQVINALGTIGDAPDVRQRCHELFAASHEGTSALPPDTASAILAVVASSGGTEQFNAFVDAYRHPDTPQEEMRYLMALAAFRDDELAGRAFDMAMTEVRTQNATSFIGALLANRTTGAGTWGRVVDHWDGILAKLPAASVPLMLGGVRSLCSDAEVARSVIEFLEGHPISVGQRSVAQILERLSVNVLFGQRMRVEAPSALLAGTARLRAQ
ncbi:MAG TPA: M1 family aminopeptidase, partial [Acidimicrobiales bacterium]|nr:M1 family aminopeptidase [Acidimicrobiales bacterium]